LHIAFFNRSYYPDTSATAQILAELCESLVTDYGHKVTVVAGVALLPSSQSSARFGYFQVLRREQHNGVDILRARSTALPKAGLGGRFSNYVSYFLSGCLAGLRLGNPDVIVSLTDPPIIGLAALLCARRYQVPFIMSYQDIFPEVARLMENFNSRAVNEILQRLNSHLAHSCEYVVALGETMRRRLIETKGADPNRTVVIPSGADCDQIRPGSKRNPYSVENRLVDQFVVMHSGNIGLSQGLEVLVDAAAHLRNVTDIQVVFVGDGVKRSYLEERVRSAGLTNVSFMPYQPKERLIESFATADVFVISLKPDLAGYIVPSKLYGILAGGRPFVAAVEDDTEVAVIADKFECGLVARPGDATDLAEKIMRLYGDSELRLRFGENARRAALQFDRKLQAKAYDDLFRRATAEFRTRRWGISKRFFDLVLSGVGLLFSLPLWLLIAVVIKVNDGGPIFYGQERVGKGGRRFKSWKFRSMIPEADKKFPALQASEFDPRITGIGRLLRATAMDELPQLWNIFAGDMSFVGPRALMPNEIEVKGNGHNISIEEVPGYEFRHRVRPGLTGIAQIFAPRDLPRRHKFRFDALYIQKQSFFLDLKLIGVSFWITFRGKWEHRGQKF
jgi:colanic acid biosynthesis glycosyl transferase WcaI